MRSEGHSVSLLSARPGIFTHDGTQAVALNEDGKANSSSNPAPAGSAITICATGEGMTAPRLPDGIVLSDALPRPAAEVFVYFYLSDDDPVPGQILEAGGLEGSFPGLLKLRVRVPEGVAPNGALPVLMAVRSGDASMIGSQVVTIAVR